MRLRVLMMFWQGMSRYRARAGTVTRFAASPIISSRRVRASCSMRSVSTSPRDRPLTMATVSRAQSSMWRIGTVSSGSDIQFLGFGQHLVAKVFTELVRSLQISAPAQDVGELFLHRKVGEARGVPLIELDEHIYVAVRGEVVAEYRAEKGQATNMMAPAEVDDAIVRDVDAHPPRGHAAATFCPSRSASLGGARDGGNLVGEVHLAVVLRLGAELSSRAGQAPEPWAVAADAVADEERHAVDCRDVLGLHHPDGLLPPIARPEI